MRAFLHTGQKQFPDSASQQLAHGMYSSIPAVEIADHADALRVGRPNCEINSRIAIDCPEMRAEFIVNAPVLSFHKQMQVDLAHDRAIAISIAHGPLVVIPRGQPQMIIKLPLGLRNPRAEKAIAMNPFGWNRLA